MGNFINGGAEWCGNAQSIKLGYAERGGIYGCGKGSKVVAFLMAFLTKVKKPESHTSKYKLC
jgi:hypothetical protein